MQRRFLGKQEGSREAAKTLEIGASRPLRLFSEESISLQEMKAISGRATLLLQVDTDPIATYHPQKTQERMARARTIIAEALKNPEFLARFVSIENLKPDERKKHTEKLMVEHAAKKGEHLEPEELEALSALLIEESEPHDYVRYSLGAQSIYDALSRHAEQYFTALHAAKTLRDAKMILERYFPEIMMELPVRMDIEYSDKGKLPSSGHITPPDEEGKSHIALFSPRPSGDRAKIDPQERVPSVFDPAVALSRRVQDLLTTIHEYTHGIFMQLTRQKDWDMPREHKYYDTADAALNEGFAIIIEVLASEKMIKAKNTLGLDEQDVKDIERFQKLRKESLLNAFRKSRHGQGEEKEEAVEAMAYTEGVIKFTHKLYKRGGIQAVKEFVANLDPEKTFRVARNSPEYKDALHDLETAKTLLSK